MTGMHPDVLRIRALRQTQCQAGGAGGAILAYAPSATTNLTVVYHAKDFLAKCVLQSPSNRKNNNFSQLLLFTTQIL